MDTVIESATKDLKDRTGDNSLRVIHDGDKFAVEREVRGEFRRQSGSSLDTCSVGGMENWLHRARAYMNRPVSEIMREDRERHEHGEASNTRERKAISLEIAQDARKYGAGAKKNFLIVNNPLAKDR